MKIAERISIAFFFYIIQFVLNKKLGFDEIYQ